jgi:AraC-like DNA-binding protein
MRFEYFTPSTSLQTYVAFVYVLDSGSAGIDAGLCALLGQVQVVIGGDASYRFGRHVAVAEHGAHLIGPSDSAGWLRTSPGSRLVGCGLTPAGWQILTQALPLANGALPLPFDGAERLADACMMAGDAPTQAATLDSYLQAQFSAAPTADPRIAVIDAWVVGGDGWDVDTLAATLALSRRSLERLTVRTHGSTPKRLAAKYRALQAAGQLAVGTTTNWRDAVAVGGFADQPHFIREFKRFVGLTPQQLHHRPESLVALLLRGNWQPGRQMGIAIWA